MYSLEWWVLILITLDANLVWPPIMLYVAYRWNKKTLSVARSIHKEVKDAIMEERKQYTMEDSIATIMDELAKNNKAMLDGFRGDLQKQFDGAITKIAQQSSGSPDLYSIAAAALAAIK